MATNSYNINVDTSQAQRAVNDLNKSLEQLSKTGSMVSSALGAVFTAASANQFITLADAATNLQNRLRLVAQEGQTSLEVFNLMARTALTLGAPIQDIGNLFFRIANNTKDLGLRQSEQLRITELLTKSFMANGLSAAEASSAVTQFGQALGRGVLQGDELNSILENAPPIAQAIADKFGVTTGALRELGSQGKITSRDIIDAMMAAGASIDRDFASRIPTIQNAMSNFGTTMEMVTQQFDKNTGASRIVVYAINEVAIAVVKISKFFEQWGGVIASVASTIAAIILPIKILGPIIAAVEGALIGVFKGFNTARIAAASFGSTFEKIQVFFVKFMDSVFPKFSSWIGMITAALASVAGFLGLKNVFDEIGKSMDQARQGGDIFARQQEEINQLLGIDGARASEKAKEATKGLSAEQLKAGEVIKKSLSDLQSSYNDFRTSFGQSTAEIGLGEEEKNRMQAQADATQRYSDAIKKVKEEMAKLNLTNSAEEQKAIADLRTAYESQIASIDGLVSARERETEIYNLNQFALQQQIALNQQLASIQDEIAKVGLTELEKKYIDIDAAAQRAAQSAIQAEQARRGGEPLPLDEQRQYYEEATRGAEALRAKTEELTKATEAYTQSLNFNNFATKERIGFENELQKIQDDIAKSTMTEIEKKYYDIEAAAKASAKAAIEAEEARRKTPLSMEEQQKYYDEARRGNEELKRVAEEQYEASRTFEAGWNKAFKAYAENANNAALQAERIFQTVTKNMEDMFVEFAKTGKFEWKSFLDSIVEELLRSQIRQLMAQVFGGMMGMGGGMGGTGGGSGFFGGLLGFANGGIIPTNGPVLVGERGPELISGALGRSVTPNESLGNTAVTYNINAVDARSFKELVAADPSFLFAVTEQGRRKLPGGR